MKKCLSVLLVLVLLLAGCSKNTVSNGNYHIDVTLTGGSGRASIESASVEMKDGAATATIVWSSPFYEYMIVDDVRYEPIQESGNATFTFPVVLDEEIAVSACTVAMSQPHEIDYTLFFDSRTLKGE